MSATPWRWSTDLVTFFNPSLWGLAADLPFHEWDETVTADPRRFFDRMLDEVAEAGLTGIELAPAPGGWVNAVRAYGSTEGFRTAVAARNLRVSSSYVLPTWLSAVLEAPDRYARSAAERAADDEMARHAAFVRELGCDTIVTSTTPRAPFASADGQSATAEAFSAAVDPTLVDRVAAEFNRIGGVAAKEGVHVAIHTDAYSLCSRTEDIELLMAATDPENIRLCIDAGHIALDGGDPLEVLRRHSKRAPVLHFKDCAAHLPPHTLTGPPMTRHDTMIRYFRLVGQGMIDWTEWVRILRERQWSGWGVAELDMSSAPVEEIRSGQRYIEELMPGRPARPSVHSGRGDK